MTINISNIPAPRVNFIDDRTGLMSREWYLFFISLFNRTGSGTTDASLVDLQIMPQAYDLSGDFANIEQQSQLNPVAPPQDTINERTNTVMIWLSAQ